MNHSQHPPLATLLAWNDGEVDGPSATTITEHVRSCAACRARLDEAMSLHALLRDLPQLTIAPDDPGLARARALAYELPRRSRRSQLQPLLLAVVVLVGVGLLALTIRPVASDAGMGINAIVRLLPRHNPERTSDAAGPPGVAIPTVSGTVTPISELAAGVLAPEILPHGLKRIAVITRGDGTGVTYASSTGLQVEVWQESIQEPLDVSVSQSVQVLVHSTPVLLSMDTPDRVSRAIWDVGDMRFQMFTIVAPSGGLSGPMTTEIISAFLSSDPA